MRPIETILGLGCVGLGIRSAVHWLRRPLDSTSARDHLLLALFVVTRSGAWFLVGAWLLLAATARDPFTDQILQGRAVLDELRDRYLWIPAVFVAALAVNLIASWFLGRRARDELPG